MGCFGSRPGWQIRKIDSDPGYPHIYYGILFSFLLYHGLGLAAAAAGLELMAPDAIGPDAIGPDAIGNIMTVINTMMVIYVLPNMVRQTSVQILSSAMHYYGDVDNRLRETQVLNAWWMFPLQLFSWNFGSTHTIHHFVVNQPFYLRQMVASAAHAAFRKSGIRFNDTARVLRANRYAL